LNDYDYDCGHHYTSTTNSHNQYHSSCCKHSDADTGSNAADAANAVNVDAVPSTSTPGRQRQCGALNVNAVPSRSTAVNVNAVPSPKPRRQSQRRAVNVSGVPSTSTPGRQRQHAFVPRLRHSKTLTKRK